MIEIKNYKYQIGAAVLFLIALCVYLQHNLPTFDKYMENRRAQLSVEHFESHKYDEKFGVDYFIENVYFCMDHNLSSRSGNQKKIFISKAQAVAESKFCIDLAAQNFEELEPDTL